MASQTAVVASDAGAYAEQVAPGLAGNVVPAGTYEPLRDAINTFFADPSLALRTGNSARKYVAINFALANEAQGLERVYDSLLSA